MKTEMTLEAAATLMSEIAINLSTLAVQWTAVLSTEPSDVHVYHYLFGPDGVRLHVQFTGYGLNDRIKISYSRPRDSRGSYCEVWSATGAKLSDPSIYVSSSKLASQIANDIIRRLLADAFHVHNCVISRIALQDLHTNNQATLYAAVCEACEACEAPNKGNVTTGQFPNVDVFTNLPGRSNFTFGYGSVVVNSNSGDINLVSVPTDLLLDLLIVIRAAIKNHARK